jgi:uncharacterized protein (TIGR02996 family)
VLYVSLDDVYEKKTFTFARDEIVVGRGADADLILDSDKVAPAHIRIRADGERVVVEDARGQLPANEVGPGDVVRVGGIALRIVARDLVPDSADAVEQRFLDAIRVAPADPEPRTVYADWLEAHGHTDRAEFLREQLATSPDAGRLAKLAATIDESWRARVATVVIEGCQGVAMKLVCPKRWDALEPTGHDGIRHCTACAQDVTYCTTIDQAQTVATARGCVAIDVLVPRKPNDLRSRRTMMMGQPSPPLARYGRR